MVANTMVIDEGKNIIKNLSFEEALAELEDIVRKFESGNIPLESAIDLYGRGKALRTYCEDKLADAKLKVEQVVISQDGNVSLKPIDTNGAI